MARKPKPSGNLNTGPFTTDDVIRALKLLGALRSSGGGHQEVYTHPTKGWKVPVSQKWTSLRHGDPIIKGIARTTETAPRDFLRLLNGG